MAYEEHHVHLAGDLRQQTQSMMSVGQDPTIQLNNNGPASTAGPTLNGGTAGLAGSGRNTPNPQATRGQGPASGTSFPNAASSSYTVPPIPGNPPPGIAAALAAGAGSAGLRTSGMAGIMSTTPGLTKGSSTDSGDAPGTPGMMDIDMQMDDEDEPPTMGGDIGMGVGGTSGMTMGGGFGGGFGISTGMVAIGGQQQSLGGQDAYYKGPPLQFVQPSMLSYTIPPPSSATAATPANHMAFNGAGQGAIGRVPRPGGNSNTGGGHHSMHHQSHALGGGNAGQGSGGHHLTEAQKAERAARKAARKEAKRIARENGEAESSDDGRDAEGFKKYRCPVEGCNKSYKQANGLKYHLNRSINSSHGHLAGMPIVPHNAAA
ncbi:hypothetical protein QFC22_006304 [Naganishia vaughanmartiniae]|uniref:Uncharacterized protein n=1 Tax=Naganishia vaughanmartiniae TaxID=1424756 RepID=A0ACC2WLM6_9TREE|nr:hypothetical protein QFC22_006304 [Naganishia vaughanmartiniae]